MRTGVSLGGRYRLHERVGAGGMGEVWRATDEVLGRMVAVKVVLPARLGEPGFVRRFLGEARAMASVNHPGVAAIHDYGSDASGAFLVMEYVEGEALSRKLERQRLLPAADAMDLVAQAADALQAVHDRGIVHRDVKPGNLMIRPDGTVLLTDFGIARANDGTGLTTTGAVLGTPSYLAPEQVLGQPATPRSDVYALGLVAYECVAGERPFEGETPVAMAMQRLHMPPRPLGADVSRSVAAVIDRALAVDPGHRWPSAAELAAAARHAVVGAPAGQAVAGRAGTRRRDQRRLAAVVAVALGVILVGAGFWGAVANRGGEPSQAPAGTAPGSSAGVSTAPRRSVPAEFVRCGNVLCPSAPMCWGGLVSVSGVAHEPARTDCGEPHYWETFVVGDLPPDAVSLRQDKLMDRSDIAAVCSAAVMADRSRDPSRTAGWRREPWPIRIDETTRVFYCLAGPEDGERTGSVFRVDA